MEITTKDYDEYVTIKITRSNHCDSCVKNFEPMSIVYYAPMDNAIVCRECAKAHTEIHPRLFTEPY